MTLVHSVGVCCLIILDAVQPCHADFLCSGGGGGWYGGGTSGDGTLATAGGGSGYVPPGGTTTVGAHAGAGYIDVVPITGSPPPGPPPGPPPVPPGCTKVLKEYCDVDRRKSAALCGLCAGTHQMQTRQAGCTNTMIANFCTNGTQLKTSQ